ncbi:MAG: SGNH/GDSL hydrolase family protein, partial [Clostridia bacterium]|nr:SGNH/GDSL hydrolase family protein [Clostridia bacterium]
KRATHLVTETRKKNTAAPIILLTVYPLLKNIPDEDNVKASRVIEEYDKTLIKLAENDDNIHLVDSAGILNDTRLLSFDGLHPSGYGNIVMADNIYDKIKHIVQVP